MRQLPRSWKINGSGGTIAGTAEESTAIAHRLRVIVAAFTVIPTWLPQLGEYYRCGGSNCGNCQAITEIARGWRCQNHPHRCNLARRWGWPTSARCACNERPVHALRRGRGPSEATVSVSIVRHGSLSARHNVLTELEDPFYGETLHFRRCPKEKAGGMNPQQKFHTSSRGKRGTS